MLPPGRSQEAAAEIQAVAGPGACRAGGGGQPRARRNQPTTGQREPAAANSSRGIGTRAGTAPWRWWGEQEGHDGAYMPAYEWEGVLCCFYDACMRMDQ